MYNHSYIIIDKHGILKPVLREGLGEPLKGPRRQLMDLGLEETLFVSWRRGSKD